MRGIVLVRSAKAAWRGGSGNGFVENIGWVKRGSVQVGMAVVGDGEGGWEEESVGGRAPGPRKKNPKLSMERNRTKSIGGLGKDQDEKEGFCGCVVA